MNRRHLAPRLNDASLVARIKSFETAFGMQAEMPDVFDLSKEDDATLEMYGLPRGSTSGFGWQCLVARRLAEHGVRCVELIDVGSSANWDAHGDMLTHAPLAKNVDQPIAALLKDLKQRGMLDETLVVWTTEFGRTPFNAAPDAAGREHHHWVFSSCLAGGGVKGGLVYGSSDATATEPESDPISPADLATTMYYLMGIIADKEIMAPGDRPIEIVDGGNVIKDLIA